MYPSKRKAYVVIIDRRMGKADRSSVGRLSVSLVAEESQVESLRGGWPVLAHDSERVACTGLACIGCFLSVASNRFKKARSSIINPSFSNCKPFHPFFLILSSSLYPHIFTSCIMLCPPLDLGMIGTTRQSRIKIRKLVIKVPTQHIKNDTKCNAQCSPASNFPPFSCSP